MKNNENILIIKSPDQYNNKDQKCYIYNHSDIPCEWRICNDYGSDPKLAIPSECRYVQYISDNNEKKYGCFDIAQIRKLDNTNLNGHLKLDKSSVPLPDDFIRIDNKEFGREIDSLNNSKNLMCKVLGLENNRWQEEPDSYVLLGNKNSQVPGYFVNTSKTCSEHKCVWR